MEAEEEGTGGSDEDGGVNGGGGGGGMDYEEQYWCVYAFVWILRVVRPIDWPDGRTHITIPLFFF